MDTIHAGLKCRTSGTTGANAESSRSHAILTYFIKHSGKVFSKMSFIDLAGSEMVKKTAAAGQTMKEAQMINKSLSALGNVIMALTKRKNHGASKIH